MAYSTEGLPKTYLLNGKRYRLHSSWLAYNNASWEAEKLRSEGWKTTIVKILGLHIVYKRREE